MKSLAEREKQRAEQKRNEAIARGEVPKSVEAASVEGEKFDAADWLNDKVEVINANLDSLTEDELNAVEKAEGVGKKRAGVIAAVKKEKESRVGKGTGWSPNQA